MLKKNLIETIIGFIVIIAAVTFAVFVYNHAKVIYENKDSSYILKAKFQNIDGIIKGSDVMIAGIKIGVVEELMLDPKTYEALATLDINKAISIPIDSRASILSSGFVGNKFITIEPGIDQKMLQNGDTIAYTGSSLNIEALIGKFMYSIGAKPNQ